jgi:diguanylate cyclase (GGDEF)-like protein
MNSWRNYAALGLVAFVLTGLLIFVEANNQAVRSVNAKGRDIFFRMSHALHPSIPEADQLLLVNIDDETLRRLELRWPYPRSIYAEMLERLSPFSPKAIGFDLIFSGNDSVPGSDQALAEAFKEAGNIVIAAHRNKEGEVGPTSLIRDNAWRVGLVDKPRDRDRVIRRTYLSLPIGEEDYDSWELELFKKAFPESPTENFPSHSSLIINYRLRFNGLPQVPFWRVIEGSILSQEVKNKIILVGLTAEAFHDIHATPFGSMPGLGINANVLLMLMRKDFFSFVSPWLTQILRFLSFWMVLVLAASSSVLASISILVALAVIYLGTSFFLFTRGVILDPWLLILSTIGVYLCGIIVRETQLWFENMRLREESSRDPLTGFYNRRFLTLKLQAEFKRALAKRGIFKMPEEISVVMIDLDNFKLVNDSFGHAEGDRVLKTMAEAIHGSVRKTEIICRYGGDEFCVILPGAPIQDAAKFGEKIRSLVANHPDLSYRTKDGTSTVRVTTSIGIASISGAKAAEPAKLMKAADRALYRAKAGGRNQVCVYDPAKDVIEAD